MSAYGKIENKSEICNDNNDDSNWSLMCGNDNRGDL